MSVLLLPVTNMRCATILSLPSRVHAKRSMKVTESIIVIVSAIFIRLLDKWRFLNTYVEKHHSAIRHF